MKLVKVRLSDEDAARVAELRSRGVDLSEVVREAVRARHLKLKPAFGPRDVTSLLESIYARHPLDDSDAESAVDTTNRRATCRFIR